MFDQSSSLAEVAVSDRPARDRANEANEIERKQRYDAGLCRDCPRKRRPTGTLCGHCRNRIERNTVRDANKQPRKGPPGRAVELGMDASMAIREATEARAMLVEAYAMPRSAQRIEAIKQAKAKFALASRFLDHIVDKLGGGEG